MYTFLNPHILVKNLIQGEDLPTHYNDHFINNSKYFLEAYESKMDPDTGLVDHGEYTLLRLYLNDLYKFCVEILGMDILSEKDYYKQFELPEDSPIVHLSFENYDVYLEDKYNEKIFIED